MGIRVSPVGWAVIGVGLVTLVAGRLLGWGELAGLGAAAALTVVAGLVLSFGKAQFEVDLELTDRRVRVGERALGRLEVVNAGRQRSLAARVELPVGPQVADLWLPSLPAQGRHEELFAIPTDRRGVIVVGPVRVRRGDPFGLVSRGRSWTGSIELFVHPRVLTLAGTRPGLLRDLEGQATRDLSDSDMSFHALRDYVAGDDRRMIHWRTSARVGALMVRQFEDTRRTRTTIVMATGAAEYATDGEFELAVSVAASLGVHVLRDERELTMLAGDRRLAGHGPAALLDECCRIARVPDGDRAVELPRRLAAEPATSSVAFLVAGSGTSSADLRSAVRQVPNGMRVVAIRCRLGVGVEVARRGLVSVATLGELDDLPSLLRRVAG
jgi:uncharacterized protein (DUF58 family)